MRKFLHRHYYTEHVIVPTVLNPVYFNLICNRGMAVVKV